MEQPIISVSGLRGIIGRSLSPDIAIRYLAAFLAELPDGPLLLARDGRTTGKMLADLAMATANASGRSVINAGIAATPTVGVLVRQLNCAGAIQISASHNPPEYNGFKLFGAEGRVISASAGEAVLARYRESRASWVDYENLGSVACCEDTTSEHLRLVCQDVDVERIRAAKFRVLLDSNRASGSILGKPLLQHLGCDVLVLGDKPDGKFEHRAEPVAENLEDVSASVTENRAVVGFCQDPDADRLAVIDGSGRYLGEEYTLAICFDHVLRSRPGPIVINCATSRMSEDIAARFEVPIYRSSVGEANVVDEMMKCDAVFGGEGNGGPIDPKVGWVRDSFVGMAIILDAMAARRQSVAQLADELPRYAIQKTKMPLDREKLAPAFDALEAAMPEARADRGDGLRLEWDDRWLLLRASNTEPIVRIIAEATTAEGAQEMCDATAEDVNGVSVR